MTNLSRLSKLLALFLRHRPEEAGLRMDPYGYVPLGEVLKAVQERYPEVREADIHQLVEGPPPPRFEIGEGGIRALYGHSFFVEMDGEPAQVPELLYMGCLRKEVQRFRTEGIKPVDRYYVHLSLTRESAAERSHQPGDPCVIEILAGQARAAGLSFYRRGEVILTRGIPVQFVGESHEVDLPPSSRPSPRPSPRPSSGASSRPSAEAVAGHRAAPRAAEPAPAFGRRPRKATGRR
ncbi:MAG: RNA 2'-phosphotransferase [Candidatus Latescibacteria bacterium]|nr:RNA 2'-phosphotransferase [Candidatus Latescibacterota bacterium]